MKEILNDNHKKILNTLRKNGLVILDAEIPTSKEALVLNDLVGSSQINWIDDDGADNRIYGYELADNKLDQALLRLAEKIFKGYVKGVQMYAFVLAGILKETKTNLGSGGGWHRDTVFGKQLKLIVYCSDVTQSNGPFQYIQRSHKWYHKIYISMLLRKNPRSFRYSETEVAALKKFGYKITECTAKAGTVIIADTTGLHRGKPIEKGVRLALTYYTHHKPFRGDLGNYGNRIY